MTVSEMDSLLFKYVGRRADATSVLRMLYLNEVQRDLSIDFFFDDLEVIDSTLSTTANTPTYAVPASAYIIEQMRNITANKEFPLTEQDWDWYNENHEFDSDSFTGPPEVWVIRGSPGGDTIWFDPTPDDAYNILISHRRLPDPMSLAPTVQPTLPADWHLIIVMQAAADMLFLFGNDARAMNLKNETLGKISARQEKRTTRRVRGSGQMKVQFVAPLLRTRGRRRLSLRNDD